MGRNVCSAGAPAWSLPRSRQTVLCTSAVRTNPFPSVTTGDESNSFLCSDLIPKSVNVGMWTKRATPVLSLEPVIYCFQPRSTFPTSAPFPCSLQRRSTPFFSYFQTFLFLFICHFLINSKTNYFKFKQLSLSSSVSQPIYHLPPSFCAGNILNCCEINDVLTSV